MAMASLKMLKRFNLFFSLSAYFLVLYVVFVSGFSLFTLILLLLALYCVLGL
jgi:hypothetical protein